MSTIEIGDRVTVKDYPDLPPGLQGTVVGFYPERRWPWKIEWDGEWEDNPFVHSESEFEREEDDE